MMTQTEIVDMITVMENTGFARYEAINNNGYGWQPA